MTHNSAHHRTWPAVVLESNALISTLLTKADTQQPAALQILRECVMNAKRRLLKAQRAGRNPSMTNFFSGERIEWSWQQQPRGAIEQCLFLATLVYADIATKTAPQRHLALAIWDGNR